VEVMLQPQSGRKARPVVVSRLRALWLMQSTQSWEGESEVGVKRRGRR
jgi:hypothetical protein